jgi:hypothetical protein
MILRNYIIAMFFIFSVFGCKPIYFIKPYDGPEMIEYTNFCELDDEEHGTMVATIAYYTGVDEYWGLTSNSKCDMDHKVYLYTEEVYQQQLNKRLNKKLDNLYKNYWKYSLKMEIVGRIEKTEKELGYGHLGLNKIQITPYHIRILGKDKIILNK